MRSQQRELAIKAVMDGADLMLSIHSQDPAGSRRRAPRTDTDLDLERRGTMRDLTPEQRAAFIYVAEELGCHTAAQHIRDDNRRRERVQAAPDPAPRPGPRPKASPATPPLLRLHSGGSEDVDRDELFWDDVRRLAGRHDESSLSLPGAVTLDAIRMLLPEPA
jgi:hypothetical protein